MVAKTLRYRHLTIPGRITTGSRTITLHLPITGPRQHHIIDAITTITHLNAAWKPWIQDQRGEHSSLVRIRQIGGWRCRARIPIIVVRQPSIMRWNL
jgi:hypothetical protein